MPNVHLFQCLPLYKPEVMARQIEALHALECAVLLDLEDSIQDIRNPLHTPALKRRARLDFESLMRRCPSQSFSLRINAVNSAEFKEDCQLLLEYRPRIAAVFVPKVEQPEDVARFFTQEGCAGFQVHPIIETQRGLRNLPAILKTPYRRNLHTVFFGNYDYHQDANVYPIQEQHSEAYWQLVEPLIATVEAHGLCFGNSPYVHLSDTATLYKAFLRLQRCCKRPFAVMSLHKTQTHFYSQLLAGQMPAAGPAAVAAADCDWEAHRQKGRSFSVFQSRIFTPQEYVLSRRKTKGA